MAEAVDGHVVTLAAELLQGATPVTLGQLVRVAVAGQNAKPLGFRYLASVIVERIPTARVFYYVTQWREFDVCDVHMFSFRC